MTPTGVALALLLLIGAGAFAAPDTFRVHEADVRGMKLNHYFTADRKPHSGEFTWTFSKDTFALSKDTGRIPADLVALLLPDDVASTTPEEITGSWSFKDGTLRLTGIKAGRRAGRESVTLEPYKTAGTVVRIGHLPQYVFETAG